jgi:hypothetical protein
VRALVALLALLAAIFAIAGGSALLLERRLAALAPGGVSVGALHYNAFTGRLELADVRARDADGHEIFRAAQVDATAQPLSLLGGALSLGRMRVAGPHLTLRTGSFDLDDVAAGFDAAHAFFGSGGALPLPVHVDDLVVGDGAVVVEGAGEGGAPLAVRDLDLRLSRLTTAAVAGRDVAFAVEMAVYGTTVHATGQPRGRGYVVHVRARGLDAVALARDFPLPALASIERGRAEIDADLVLSDGRVVTTGFVRLNDAVVALPLTGRPRLRAASIAVAADAVDLARGAGRIARLDLVAPVLTLPTRTAAGTVTEALPPLRADGDLTVRRISITDGALTLQGTPGIRLSRLQLAAHLPERRGSGGWVVSAQTALGDHATVSVDGLVTRDLRGLDVFTRLVRVPLGPWRALAGAAPGWDGRVTFDGRVRMAARDGDIAATAAGQAELSDVRGSVPGGFRAERIALAIRQLRWPSAEAVFDRVVVTRPAFGLDALAAWSGSLVTTEMSVVDGELRGDGPGRALHGLAMAVAPGDAGLARLRVSASTETGSRVDLDRLVGYPMAAPGLPLGLLASTLSEAARVAVTPPAAVVAPSTLPTAVLP